MTADGLPPLDERTALFLDVDGTLIEIAPTPDAVVVPAGLGEMLRRLQDGLGGALALVTGRSLASIDSLFAPLVLPAAGQHGAELRRRGDRPAVSLDREPALDTIAARAAGFAAETPGILTEDKGLSIAIHYRQVPQRGEEVRRFVSRLVTESGADIVAMPLHMAFDVKPRAISKRSAVEWFMRETPFLGRVPVFVGDDRTDEDGFAGVLALGGHAVRVGLGEPTIAPTRIASAQAVRAWLAAVAHSLPLRRRLD
jgi:trehalose 6-phosphate phosphatase